MEKKLEVKDLVISFRTVDGKVQAVRNINFDLYKGETLAIVGESGSGKSVTSKAIIGISAPNAIVENGEILYDGQDLLRISEEDFHKIRGDKIAMIFQDPLSSLNPIVKIGTQLTEAMILKNRASRRNSRHDFNSKLQILLDNLNEYEKNNGGLSDEEAKANKELADTFNKFNIEAVKLEKIYHNAKNAGEEILPDIETLLINIERQNKVDYKNLMTKISTRGKEILHPFFVEPNGEANDVLEHLIHNIPAKGQVPNEEFKKNLEALDKIIKDAQNKIEPNFFCIGYYVLKNPEDDIYSMDIEELNKMARDFIDKDFMLFFIEKTKKALMNAEEKANAAKKEVIEKFKEELNYFSQDTIDKKVSNEKVKELTNLVNASINKLEVTKDSLAYTFKYSFKTQVNKYFQVLKSNENEQKRFDRETAKFEKKVSKGKTLDYKVSPLALIDEKAQLRHICLILERLIEKYEAYLSNNTFDFDKVAIDVIDYFKSKAKDVCNVITRGSARAKAIKLMEEVGIPEPALRFKQYPFEFSGGMRQRIVIAIALAADPDILICDEPTTALDVTIQAQILELINKIKKERNLSIIFITHDLGVVANMADKIAVMYAGKIVEYGTDQDIFYDPRHPYTWALLSSMPDLETKEKLEAIPGTPPNMIYPPVGDAFAARNKYALDIDFEAQPPMFKITDSHYAATWLLHPNAPQVEPPKIVTARIERIKKMMGGKSHE